MATITTDPSVAVDTFPTQTVETIAYLGAPGGWVAQSDLYCDKLTLSVNGYDKATLTYAVGERVNQVGYAAYANYQPLALRGKFVRVTIVTTPSNIVWIGYVQSDEVLRDAVKNVAGTNKLVGKDQVIQCVGLEYFLDRKQIDSAVIRVNATPNYLRIQRPLVFNGGPTSSLDPGSAVRGNRSTAVGAAGVFDFSNDFEGAPLWNGQQIVDHLLKYHTPLNAAGAAAPAEFILHPSDVGFLSGYYPTLRTEGISVFEALNKICSPQRGLCWWAEYTDGVGAQIKIRVQSAATAAVTLPGGGTLPANNNQETLDFDGERDVSRVSVKQIGSRDYHQVIARGARMTSTCTVGCPDATLIPDWSQLTGSTDAGTEKKYKDAAKGDGDYTTLDDDKKKKRNDSFRKADAYHKVFSAFRIPYTWDGKTGDGGTGQRNWALPILSSSGSIVSGMPINQQGLKLLNTLRLKRGWDYSNPTTPKSATPSGSLGELAPPFAFMRTNDSPEKFQLVEKLRDTNYASNGTTTAALKTSYHLYMQQTVPGIRLAHSGGMPHSLALNHWDATAEPSGTTPELDYAQLRATVCLEADAHCEAKYPETGFPANTPLEILLLDMGPHYRLDFLAANTITGFNGGLAIKSAAAAVLRDDRKYLADIARMAYEWYQTSRSSLDVTFRQVRPLFERGMLITTIGTGSTQTNINTCVTAITYDMQAGTMQIQTADKSIDLRSLVT